MEMIFIATLMEAAIIVLVLAILFVAVQVIRKRKPGGRLSSKKQVLDGEVAKAIVLAIEQTGLFLNHRPQVKMQMQVIPDRGRNFVVEIREIMSYVELATIRTGSTVLVKFNPSNPKEIELLKAA
jgi:hypothetical protein